MEKPEICILVIFGASGDLTRRKLMTALFDLYRQDFLPEKFAILGVSRSGYSDESFRERMENSITAYCEKKPLDKNFLRDFVEKNILPTHRYRESCRLRQSEIQTR